MQIVKRYPTKTDVDLLIERIGIPKEGEFISREMIRSIMNLPSNSSRLNTIIGKYKERMFICHNVYLFPNYQGGWIVSNPNDRISEASRIRKNAIGRLGMALTVGLSADTKRLSEPNKKVQSEMRKSMNDAKLMLAESLNSAQQ